MDCIVIAVFIEVAAVLAIIYYFNKDIKCLNDRLNSNYSQLLDDVSILELEVMRLTEKVRQLGAKKTTGGKRSPKKQTSHKGK